MNKPIVIVGTAMLAEQVHYYFTEHARRVVEAFAVDAEYLREDRFCSKPVLEFEEALRRYPATTHELFLAIGFTATEVRKRKFIAARERGYTLPSYVHPSALCGRQRARRRQHADPGVGDGVALRSAWR